MVKYPDNQAIENNYNKTHTHNNTYLCFGYDKDLIQIYCFYCARYKDISYEEFLDLGISEVLMKLSSIPKEEPLYDIIKSRTLNVAKIKDKEERKYWQELKQINKIPDIYLPSKEIEQNLKEKLGGLKNGKRFM